MLSALFAGASLIAAASASFASSPIVKGSPGLSYVGLRNVTSGEDYFLGIPFAQPPLGSLRFKPPVPWVPGSSTVVNATQAGFSYVQPAILTTNAVSEDCLTLNIYGGAFWLGDIASFPGNDLVQRSIQINKPIIYVAMNYRVGVYGFPPGKAAVDAGGANLGLKDQRLALEWIQKNIGSFGGDSNKVTIFGESAGAISSGYQAFYKGGNTGGVFRGMILESGSPSTVPVLKPNDPVKEEAFRFIANATGCGSASNPFECVRRAPTDVLAQANVEVMNLPPYYREITQFPSAFVPTQTPNDDFLTDLPSKLLHSGKFAKVPFINGFQLDEGTMFINGTSMNAEQDIVNRLTARFTGLNTGISNVTAARELLEFYPTDPAAGSPYCTGNDTFGQGAQYKRAVSVVADLLFEAPNRDHHIMATKIGVKTWSYIMKEKPIGFVPLLGVLHGGELPFVRQTVGILDPNASPAVLELAHTIGDYWINFAYYLDPNPKTGVKLPNWPNYGKDEKTLQLLASNITPVGTPRIQAKDFIIQNPDLYN